MANEKTLLTKEGYEKILGRLEYLTTTKRDEIAEKLKTARGFGDLSENSEYDEAKNEQASVELEILELEQKLKSVEIIDAKPNSKKVKKVVSIGDTVTILDSNKKKELILQIVGTLEADIALNKISNESPLGKALLNAKKGDVVSVKAKANTVQYEILEIK